MIFYVASSFNNYAEARRVMNMLRDRGHTISCDWTDSHQFDEDGIQIKEGERDLAVTEQVGFAVEELQGAINAQILVLLWTPDVGGAMVEVGAALASGRPVCVIGSQRWTIFWSLPHVQLFDTVEQFFDECVDA